MDQESVCCWFWAPLRLVANQSIQTTISAPSSSVSKFLCSCNRQELLPDLNMAANHDQGLVSPSLSNTLRTPRSLKAVETVSSEGLWCCMARPSSSSVACPWTKEEEENTSRSWTCLGELTHLLEPLVLAGCTRTRFRSRRNHRQPPPETSRPCDVIEMVPLSCSHYLSMLLALHVIIVVVVVVVVIVTIHSHST